jgi:hypothetical protein
MGYTDLSGPPRPDLLARRLMAGHRSLEPAVVVRIHPGQSLARNGSLGSSMFAPRIFPTGAHNRAQRCGANWRWRLPTARSMLDSTDAERHMYYFAQARVHHRGRNRSSPLLVAMGCIALGGACSEAAEEPLAASTAPPGIEFAVRGDTHHITDSVTLVIVNRSDRGLAFNLCSADLERFTADSWIGVSRRAQTPSGPTFYCDDQLSVALPGAAERSGQ